MRRSHMRSEPYYDELYTFRGDTKQRRHRRNGGSSCAMDERRCGHDMMIVLDYPILEDVKINCSCIGCLIKANIKIDS